MKAERKYSVPTHQCQIRIAVHLTNIFDEVFHCEYFLCSYAFEVQELGTFPKARIKINSLIKGSRTLKTSISKKTLFFHIIEKKHRDIVKTGEWLQRYTLNGQHICKK